MKLENPHLDYFPSLVAMFFDRAEQGGEAPFLWRKADRSWQPLSWRQVANQVSALAHNLRALGLKEGDRVVLVSENRPEFCIADLGRSEEHTSELQYLMRISYAVFCLTTKNKNILHLTQPTT